MISDTDLVHVLVGLVAILLAAHGGGTLFARFRQPTVIGEILGGLLIGPTVLGALVPDAEAWLFTDSAPTRAVVGAVQQLGIFLLMFCSGVEVRKKFRSTERRLVITMSISGLVLPFFIGISAVQLVDLTRYWGQAGTTISFALIFSAAIAVTSIPVISRIMHDLGILKTSFARIVLGVAVVEDVVLYAILAVAVGLSGQARTAFGLPAALGLHPGSVMDIVYHVALTVGPLLALFLASGPMNRWVSSHQPVKVPLDSTNRRLVSLLAVTLLYLVLDLESFLGAFVAGIAIGSSKTPGTGTTDDVEQLNGAQDVVRRFAYAFFIPVYFALVGVNLNLRHSFGVGWFLIFFALVCGAKTTSVYLGGRLARLANRPSINLAIALNARGGPGIVLATVTFSAGIISEEFYIWLVLLAVLTSLLAGTWLQRLPKSAFDKDLHLLAAKGGSHLGVVSAPITR